MDIFTALAEPTRRTIVEMLARSGPLSATEISEQFPVSPPAISQHLKLLREANVVHREKRAQQCLYRLNPDALFELEGWARYMTHLWNQRFDALERVVEAEKKNIEKHDLELKGAIIMADNNKENIPAMCHSPTESSQVVFSLFSAQNEHRNILGRKHKKLVPEPEIPGLQIRVE